MRGVYYSACSLCYKTIAQFHQKYLLMRDCLLFRRLLLPESSVCNTEETPQPNFLYSIEALKVRPHVLFSVYDMEISTYILPHLRNTNENVKNNNIYQG